MLVYVQLLVLVSSLWVAYDAAQHDWSHSGFARSWVVWFIGSLLLWIIVFPLYLAARHKAPRKGERRGMPIESFGADPAPAPSSATSVAPPGFSD